MKDSFEAIAKVRKYGSIGIFESKWLTVPNADVSAAIAAFNALGYEVNNCRVFTQQEATDLAHSAFN